MSWFKRDDFEVRKLREEVRELQGELMKLRESTAMYETLNPLEMLGTRSFGFYFQDKSVPISAVVYGIVKHLGSLRGWESIGLSPAEIIGRRDTWRLVTCHCRG